jgi:hypothetical protein
MEEQKKIRNVNVCMLEGNIDFSDIETTGYFSINQYHLYKHPEHHQKLVNNIIDIIKIAQTVNGLMKAIQ